MPPLLTLLVYVLAGLGGGLLALRTGIPAAPLAGALLGAALVSMSGRLEVAQWPHRPDPMREVDTKVKTAFTRRYNKEGGFLPYSIVQHAKKKSRETESSEFGEEVTTFFLFFPK